jgi:hypothetical protein
VKRLAFLLLALTTAPVLAQAVRPVPRPPGSTVVQPPLSYPTLPSTPEGIGLYRPESGGAPAPRSPNTRVLPATTEPGVWAADGDPALRASASAAGASPEILGVALPLSPEGKSAAAGSCASTVADILKRLGIEQELLALPEPARRCAAALLYAQCIQESKHVDPWDYRTYRPKREQDRIVAEIRSQKDRHYSEDEKRARAFVEAVCPGVGAGRPDLLDKVDHYWEMSRRAAR